MRSRALVAAWVGACALVGVAAAEGAQYDRFGRRVDPGVARVVLGPLPGTPWRQALAYGMELPIGVDAVAIRGGLGPVFRMLLPGAGPAGRVVDLVVENVQAEDIDLDGAPVGFVPAASLVYTGTVRGRPDVVVVLSVVNDVLYARVAFDDEVWVVYSDSLGRAMVRLERLVDGDLGRPGFSAPRPGSSPPPAAARPGLPGGIRRPERRPGPSGGGRRVRPR